MKYKLINRTTKEEHLCEKVTIEGWDYYVSGEVPKIEDYGLTKLNTITKIGYGFDYKLYKKVIATNDPSIDFPKVVDEVEILAYNWLYDDETKMKASQAYPLKPMEYGFIKGYNKSQETHPFSENDMIEFMMWCIKESFKNGTSDFIDQELLQIWKSQRHKVICFQ